MNLWQRIKAWFKRTSSFGNEIAVAKGASNLVERARQGDQVAIATLCEIRKAAARGEPRGKKALKEVLDYCKAHPVQIGIDMDLPNPQVEDAMGALRTSLFGAEQDYVGAVLTQIPMIGAEEVEKAAVVLSQGPDIYSEANPRISAIADQFDPQQKEAFCLAVIHSGSSRELQKLMNDAGPACNNAILIVWCVGIARRIQGVRRTDTPVALLSKAAAWELGE